MRNLAYFATMSVIWGLTWAAVKIGLEVLPPLALAALRYILSAVLLIPAVHGVGAAFSQGFAVRTVASALLVNAGTYGLLFWGIQSVPSGLAGLVNLALIPVLMFALAVIVGEQRQSWRHALALTVGCGGLVVLFRNRIGLNGADAIGLAAIIAGTACYCVGSLVARPLLDHVKPLTLTMVQAAIGGAALMLASVVLEPQSYWPAALLDLRAIGSLGFLSVPGTIVAYTIYLALLRDWGLMRASLYAFISPILALIAGAFLFNEPVGPTEFVGAALLLASAAVALANPGRAQQ